MMHNVKGIAVGLALLVLLGWGLGWGQSGEAPGANLKRVAMVIGNARYTGLQALTNPENDAQAMAERLKQLGYQLIGLDGKPTDRPILDLDQESLLQAIETLARVAVGQEIAFLYYAGHGFHNAKGSYLIPVRAEKPKLRLDALEKQSVSLDDAVQTLAGKARMTVAVFDACRDIPEIEALAAQTPADPSRGSASAGKPSYRGMDRVKGQLTGNYLIAYAGAPGQAVQGFEGGLNP